MGDWKLDGDIGVGVRNWISGLVLMRIWFCVVGHVVADDERGQLKFFF